MITILFLVILVDICTKKSRDKSVFLGQIVLGIAMILEYNLVDFCPRNEESMFGGLNSIGCGLVVMYYLTLFFISLAYASHKYFK